MKKLLYSVCTGIMLLGACAKKATPDRMMCDCLDKETADYITAHPNLTTDDLATAKEAIGTPCLAELQKEYPESEGKVFEKQHSKEEANTMMENIKRCGTNLEITLQKVIDKSAVVASKTTNDPADEDSVGFIIDSEANDRTEHSADNCEDFLNKYEDYADSYATLAAKYARNPSDVSIVSEYTNMATKSQEMKQDKPGTCEADAAFLKRYTRIAAKVTRAMAAQTAGSAQMLEQMSK